MRFDERAQLAASRDLLADLPLVPQAHITEMRGVVGIVLFARPPFLKLVPDTALGTMKGVGNLF